MGDGRSIAAASGRELPGNQAEPSGEIATRLEAFASADRRHESRRDDHADTGDRDEQARFFKLFHPGGELGVESRDPVIHSPCRSAFRPLVEIEVEGGRHAVLNPPASGHWGSVKACPLPIQLGNGQRGDL